MAADPDNLLDLPPAAARDRLRALLTGWEAPSYRTDQVLQWLWQRPVRSWSEATNLPGPLRERLEAAVPIRRLGRARTQTSSDGTVKVLWTLPDGLAVESVWIPERDRATLCISSQAGCAYGCVFCATGRMGFQRHLAPWEIAGQVRELALDRGFGVPTNIVFMGMGEPLHNWSGVDTALTILNDPDGFGIGARRITVSTIGLIPPLRRFAERPEQFRLALSLHAPTSARRGAIMPVERKYPLDRLLPELRRFRKRITFEYVLIAGANDAPDDATALGDLAREYGAMVNLLPLHPGGAPGFIPVDRAGMERFAARVRSRGATVTVRRSRGLDISAACGQLRVESLPA